MKLGLSQDQLAKSVKEKLSVIQKIEIGKMSPTPDYVGHLNIS